MVITVRVCCIVQMHYAGDYHCGNNEPTVSTVPTLVRPCHCSGAPGQLNMVVIVILSRSIRQMIIVMETSLIEPTISNV